MVCEKTYIDPNFELFYYHYTIFSINILLKNRIKNIFIYNVDFYFFYSILLC